MPLRKNTPRITFGHFACRQFDAAPCGGRLLAHGPHTTAAVLRNEIPESARSRRPGFQPPETSLRSGLGMRPGKISERRAVGACESSFNNNVLRSPAARREERERLPAPKVVRILRLRRTAAAERNRCTGDARSRQIEGCAEQGSDHAAT